MIKEKHGNKLKILTDVHTVEQIELIQEATKILNMITVKRYATEADDIIASITYQFASEIRPIIIVTSDKDLYQ